MTAPLVSVLMTAYNRDKYIGEAIESVLASTFGDFELVIVDDASKDRTVEIARSYADPRVKVYVNEKNLGDYNNRNRAAELAQGKYLKYLDSDDIMYPFGLQVMAEAMEKFPRAALAMSRKPSADGPYPLQIEPQQAYREHFLKRGLLDEGPSGSIMRADAFRAVGGFSGKRFVGDNELWFKLAAQYPMVKMPKDLIWWRQHPGQEFLEGFSSLSYLFMIHEIVMDALTSPHCPLTIEETSRAIRLARWRQSRRIWRLAVKERKVRPAMDLYRGSGLSVFEMARGLAPSFGRV